MKINFILLLAVLMFFSCEKDNPERNYSLDNAFEDASKNENLICLIVFKDDNIVKEAYFQNSDPNTVHDVRSVTKSVMATLIGIAIDKHILPSEHELIGDYLKFYFSAIDEDKSNIKISDILTMSSGISGNELVHPNEYINWFNSSNQIEYTLNKPMDSQSGQKFNYNSGVSHLLSGVLTQANGYSLKEFANDYFFQALGINNSYWQTDKQGLNNGAAGLQLTPYDMLKIGRLYLDKGIFHNKRVVSENWIEKTTSVQISTDGAQPFGPSYGYLWWIGEANNYKYFFANGYGGQFLVVVPEINLIVIATNKWLGINTDTANRQWYSTLDIIINKIIPLY